MKRRPLPKTILNDYDYAKELYARIYPNSSERDFDEDLIVNTLKLLTSSERKILEYRYKFGKTQKELGEMLNIPQPKISIYDRTAISRLREYTEKHLKSTNALKIKKSVRVKRPTSISKKCVSNLEQLLLLKKPLVENEFNDSECKNINAVAMILSLPLETLPLNSHSRQFLEQCGCETVMDIYNLSKEEFDWRDNSKWKNSSHISSNITRINIIQVMNTLGFVEWGINMLDLE